MTSPAYKKEPYSYRVLVKNRAKLRQVFQDIPMENASVEDIMLFYVKGEKSEMKGIMLKDLYENFYIKKNLASYIFGALIVGLAAFFYRYALCLYTLYNAF